MAELTVQTIPDPDLIRLDVSGGAGTFVEGEAVVFATSGATGIFQDIDGSGVMSLYLTGGIPEAAETVTGQDSAATRTVDGFADSGVVFSQPTAEDTYENDGQTLLIVSNGLATPVVIEYVTQRESDYGLKINRRSIAPPNEISIFPPVSRSRFNSAGMATIRSSSQSPSVGYAVVRVTED